MFITKLKKHYGKEKFFRFESGLIADLGELVIEDININGPQSTITNGLEAIGIPQDFIKGIFK